VAFLNPLLLLGATAIAVPIIIHLMNRRKYQIVSWAAMKFLRASVTRNRKRLRIEDLLLLLLRCMVILLIALAAARPALRSASAGAGFLGPRKVAAVLILDNSYSMSQTDGTTSRFDQSKKSLLAAMDTFPSGSTASLSLASDSVDALVPEPTVDLNLVRKAINDARMCDRASDLSPAIRSAIDVLNKQPLGASREIYLATDGQALAFKDLDGITRALDQVKADMRAHVVLAGGQPTQNLAVSEMRLGNEIPAVGRSLRFDVEVTNFGTTVAKNVPVTLAIDGRPPSDQAIIDTLDPLRSRTVTLYGRMDAQGYHAVTGALPADRLPADDTRTLVVHAVAKVSVLLVDGDPRDSARDAETFYLRHALVPVAAKDVADYFVKATVVSATDLANARFDDFDVVVLADVPELSAAQAESLSSYVRRGNGLLIFPGPRTNVEFYNNVLLKQWNLLPASLGDARGDADNDQKFIAFSPTDVSHPIVSIWKDPANGDIGRAKFFRTYLLKPVENPPPATNPLAESATTAPSDALAAGATHTILRYTDGTPAMMERDVALGRVVLSASTAATEWNDLPVNAGLFVPLMQRTLGWLGAAADRNLNVTVGDELVVHPSPELLGQEAVVSRPPAAPGGTESRRVELADHVPTVTYAQTNWAGVYNVQLADKTLMFGVQRPAADSPEDSESNPAELSPAQLDKLAASADVVRPGASLAESVGRGGVGTELWFAAAVAALILAASETMLQQWFSKSK
jgi:hypothetical protein